jgi:uncharacterized protein
MFRRIRPFKYGLAIVVAVVLILVVSFAAFGLKPFTIREYVTDQAGILSEGTRGQLANLLSEYAKQTTNQILVVTIPSLEEESLEDFALRLAELNKPGQKGKDNGIILLVAEQERKVRIEVGYGLEGQVPDGKAGTIIREQIIPYFKNGDYNSGITAGTYALITAITPDYQLPTGQLQEAPPVQSRRSRTTFPGVLIMVVILGIFSWISSLRNNNRRVRRGYSEPWFWGGGGGGGFSGGSGGGFSGGGGSFGGGGSSGSW